MMPEVILVKSKTTDFQKEEIFCDVAALSAMSRNVDRTIVLYNSVLIWLTFVSAVLVVSAFVLELFSCMFMGIALFAVTLFVAGLFGRQTKEQQKRCALFCEEIEQKMRAVGCSVSDFV